MALMIILTLLEMGVLFLQTSMNVAPTMAVVRITATTPWEATLALATMVIF